MVRHSCFVQFFIAAVTRINKPKNVYKYFLSGLFKGSKRYQKKISNIYFWLGQSLQLVVLTLKLEYKYQILVCNAQAFSNNELRELCFNFLSI